MRQLTSIVAVNAEGAIGAGNALPWRVRSDLKFFRAQTLGNVVIMGRKTYDSLGRPLPDRRNVVVTHGFAFFPANPDCRAAGSIEEALVVASQWHQRKREVFVVGGASMYEQFAPFVDRYLITKVDKSAPDADTFFSMEELGNSEMWDMNLVASGKANGTTDESDFSIFEFRRRDSSAVERRDSVLTRWQSRKYANALNADFANARMAT